MIHERRRGASLAELLVALTVLALGGMSATRVLFLAARELDGAELSIRAALFLAELASLADLESEDPLPGEPTRPAGPGLLRAEVEGPLLLVRFEPPGGEAGGGVGIGHSGGFHRPRSWSVEPFR